MGSGMTPQEALQVLDLAAGAALLNRIQHVQVQEANKILAEVLQRLPTVQQDGGAEDNK